MKVRLGLLTWYYIFFKNSPHGASYLEIGEDEILSFDTTQMETGGCVKQSWSEVEG